MNNIDHFYNELLNSVSHASGAAYIHGKTNINYPEFLSLAERIHSRLAGHKNVPVITIVGKGISSYAAILAIILSGNTWVPLSPSAPTRRNASVFTNFEKAILVFDHDLDTNLAYMINQRRIENIDLRRISDRDPATSFDPIGFSPENNAMIYFTSGSTGEPKGVQVTHQNYINVINNIMKLLPWPTCGVFADYHELSFVISIPILFPCWLTGSAIAPALSNEEMFLPVSNMLNNRVNVLITVPSTIARLRQTNPEGINGVRLEILVSCGEPLQLDVLDYCLKLADQNHVFNFYGSTEVSPWTFYHACQKNDSSYFQSIGYAPIGRLLPGNKMRLVPETSELLIAGPQVTPGYLDTQNAYKFSVMDDLRWYHTGDKVVEIEGLFFCKGRLDSQIKINGFRVEPLDIETHLRSLPGVIGVICFADQGPKGRQILTAVLHSDRDISLSEVRHHLVARLPSYMIPRKVVTARDLPYNKSGKIDRLAVQKQYTQQKKP